MGSLRNSIENIAKEAVIEKLRQTLRQKTLRKKDAGIVPIKLKAYQMGNANSFGV